MGLFGQIAVDESEGCALALNLLDQHKTAEAINLLQQLIDNSPDDNRSKFILAKTLRSQRKSVEITSEYVVNPFSITNIELTNRCPFKCVMCPRTKHMTRPKGDMQFQTFQRVVDELSHVNRVNSPGCILYLHHFGESLLHAEFGAFVRYANRLGLFTSASINPLMLTDRVINDLVCSEIGLLQIALDGHDNESFARIRGVERAYDASRERLLRYLKAKIDRGASTRVVLNIIDFPGDQEMVAKGYEQWGRVSGIDAVFLKPFVTWNGSAQDINALAQKGIIAMGSEHLPVICTEPFDSLNVAWDGQVLMCCFDYDNKFVLGNVGQNTLTEIWNGDRLCAARREFISGRVSNPLCRTCSYLRRPIDSKNVLEI